MQKKTLQELIRDLEQELLRLGYTKGSITFYRRRWRMLDMNKYTYYGPFKNHIQDFIELKQAVGYKYLSEVGHLKRFDTFTLEKYSTSESLNKEIVMDWCTKKSYEKQGNLCASYIHL